MTPFPSNTMTHELTRQMDIRMSEFLDKTNGDYETNELSAVVHSAVMEVLEDYVYCHDSLQNHVKITVTISDEAVPFKIKPENLYTLVIMHGVPVLPFEVENKTSVAANGMMFVYEERGFDVVPLDPEQSLSEDEHFTNSMH